MKVWMRGWKKVERIHSVGSYTAVMAMGKRIKERREQTEFWVGARSCHELRGIRFMSV